MYQGLLTCRGPLALTIAPECSGAAGCLAPCRGPSDSRTGDPRRPGGFGWGLALAYTGLYRIRIENHPVARFERVDRAQSIQGRARGRTVVGPADVSGRTARGGLKKGAHYAYMAVLVVPCT